MRNSIITISLFGALVFAPLSVNAATITFSPETSSGEIGDTVSFVVSVASSTEETAYTTRLELDYPTDMLDFESFQQADGWQSLTQEGYDVVDENAGTVIKTAGFPGGFSNSQIFGTITFTNIATGSDSVVAVDATAIYDENNNDISESLPTQASVNVTEAQEVSTTTEEEQTTQPTGETEETQTVDSIETTVEDEESTTTEQETATTTSEEEQTAAVGNVFTNSPLLTSLVLLFAIATGIFAYLWWRERRSY